MSAQDGHTDDSSTTELVWRTPAAETENYPGLVVNDGRVTGSITAGRSRLPLWAFISPVVHAGWDVAADGWDADQHTDPDTIGRFLYDLLEHRGEFARLLTTLADIERLANEREDAAVEAHFGTHHPTERVCECGINVPRAWWQHHDLRARVSAQLATCLAAVERIDRAEHDGQHA